MIEDDHDYKNDELVNVKLPRGDLEIIRNVIKREKAYNWFTGAMKSTSIWIVAGGVVTLFVLWDKIIALIGVK